VAFSIFGGRRYQKKMTETKQSKIPSVKWSPFADCVAASTLLLVVLYCVNSSWLFLAPGPWIDPFIYTGYMIYGPLHVHAFKDLYYTSRIPAIALGWFAHSAASDPSMASIMLRFTYGLVLALGAAAGARAFSASRAAPKMAIALALLNPYVLWAIGWDYVDGAALAYLSATLGAASLAAARRSWIIASVAGACYALAVSTYFMLVLFAPILVLIGISAGLPFSLRSALRIGLAATGGFALAIALTGVLSSLMGGRFLYVLPQINAAFSISANRAAWKAPTYDWIEHASWLLIPGAATLAAGIFALYALVRLLSRTRDIQLLLLCVGQLLVASMFLAFELSGYWLLQFSYNAVYLNAISVVSLIALWSRDAEEDGAAPHARTWLPMLVFVGVILATWGAVDHANRMGGACSPSSCLWFSTRAGGYQAALVLALVVAAVGILRPVTRGLVRLWWKAAASALVLGCLSIVFALSFPSTIFQWPNTGAYQRQYLDLVHAVRVIRDVNPNLDLYFWYNDSDAELGGFGRALASAHVYGDRLISSNFPSTRHPWVEKLMIQPGTRIIVLSQAPDAMRLANEAIASLNLAAQVERQVGLPWKGKTIPFSVVRVISR